MKRALLVSTIVGIIVFSVAAAHACGDKLLALGRGVRYDRAYKAARPANILVFDREDTGKDRAEAARMMAAFGHHMESVATAEDMATALQARHFDLVLTSVADAVVVESAIASAHNKPAIVVFVHRSGKLELAAATQRYRWALKAPTDMMQVLATIDAAMDFHARQPEHTAQKD